MLHRMEGSSANHHHHLVNPHASAMKGDLVMSDHHPQDQLLMLASLLMNPDAASSSSTSSPSSSCLVNPVMNGPFQESKLSKWMPSEQQHNHHHNNGGGGGGGGGGHYGARSSQMGNGIKGSSNGMMSNVQRINTMTAASVLAPSFTPTSHLSQQQQPNSSGASMSFPVTSNSMMANLSSRLTAGPSLQQQSSSSGVTSGHSLPSGVIGSVNGLTNGSQPSSVGSGGNGSLGGPVTGMQYTLTSGAPSSYFAVEDLRHNLLVRQSLSLSCPNPDAYPEVPPTLNHVYHSLVPLEDPNGPFSPVYTCHTSCYKGTHVKTGEVVCLRRIHNYQPRVVNQDMVMATIDAWKKVTHSSVCRLRDVFTTRDFNDISLMFVTDYFPGATTLHGQYFAHSVNANVASMNGGVSATNRPYSQQTPPKMLPETLIWSYIIQLSSALKTIHAAGLAVKSLDGSKILMTSGHIDDPQFINHLVIARQSLQHPRLRINGVAIVDLLKPELMCKNAESIKLVQNDDLFRLGRLILSICCLTNQSAKSPDQLDKLCFDYVRNKYSHDLVNVITLLLGAKDKIMSITEIMPLIGGRFYTALDTSYHRYDLIESEMMKEMDNGRLFRVMCKMMSILERPDLKMDPNWSETGDRYLVKLFRDYLFHQVDEEGRPWMDFGHIVCNLNKLDVASPERICLVSRDSQNVLIVSYAELKKCFDSSFSDLLT